MPCVVPFIAVVVRIFGKRLRRVAKGQQESMGRITQVLQETIEGHKVVKIFSFEILDSKIVHHENKLDISGFVLP